MGRGRLGKKKKENLTVVHDDVVLDPLGSAALQLRATGLRRDVVHEGGAPADGFDGGEIHADDGGRHGHVLDGDLKPTTGCGA